MTQKCSYKLHLVLALITIHANASEIQLLDALKNATQFHPELNATLSLKAASESQLHFANSSFYPEFGIEGGWQQNHQQSNYYSENFGYAYGRYSLLNSGKDRVNSQRAELNNSFENKKFLAVKQSTYRSVSLQFLEIHLLKEEIKLKQSLINETNAQIQFAKKKHSSGLTSEVDVIEFELRISDLELAVHKLEINLEDKITELNSNLKTNYNASDDFIINYSNESLSIPSDEWLIRQELANPEQLENAKNVTDEAIQSNLAVLNYFPRINLEANYGKLNPDLTRYSGRNEFFFQAMFTLPLFSGFSTSSSTNEHIEKMQFFEIKETQNRLLLKAKAEQDYKLSKLLLDQIQSNEKKLIFAKKYFELTNNEYKRGVKNSTDLASATDRLFETQAQILQTKVELTKLYFKYHFFD